MSHKAKRHASLGLREQGLRSRDKRNAKQKNVASVLSGNKSSCWLLCFT